MKETDGKQDETLPWTKRQKTKRQKQKHKKTKTDLPDMDTMKEVDEKQDEASPQVKCHNPSLLLILLLSKDNHHL